MKNIVLFFVFIFFGLNSKAQEFIKLWETEPIFSGPESVVFDSARNYLYVSNFKPSNSNKIAGSEFISKVDLKGNVIELKWIKDLTEPLGLTIFHDKLYIVERKNIAIVDLKSEVIIDRIFIDSCRIINDVAVGNDSSIYVSECDTKITYIIKNKESRIFLNDDAAPYPNGLLFDKNRLLVCSNGDSTLKAVNINTGETIVIGQLKKGIIDGIQTMGNNYLVSFFEGNLFLITPFGEVVEILNTRDENINIADFVFIEEKGLLIAPALDSNKLVAFKLK